MAIDPESVELYQYFYSDGPGLPLAKQKRKRERQVETKLEHMIVHYMEEEHCKFLTCTHKGVYEVNERFVSAN